MPPPEREAKELLHEQLSQFSESQPDLCDAVMTRYVVVTEWVLPGPGERKALYKVSGDQSGADLRSWEAAGLLSQTLTDYLRDQ